MPPYTTTGDPRGGTWHIYPGGRKVYVAPAHTAVAPTAAAAPASYDVGPPPVDPTLLAQQATARQTLALGDASDAYQKAQLSNEYGIGDTSNPFSRAKLLQASYLRSQGANTNNYAKQGQLYSGALQTAQNAATNTYNQGSDSLNRAYQAAQNKLALGKVDRYAQAGQTMDTNTYNSVQRQITGLGS